MNFEEQTRAIIRDYKLNFYKQRERYIIPIRRGSQEVGYLRPVPSELHGEAEQDAVLQTNWRNLHKDTFLVPAFTATVERTMNWLKAGYFENDQVLVFIVHDQDGLAIGHIGVSDFIWTERQGEYGRLMRGALSPLETKLRFNLLELSVAHFLDWCFKVLQLDSLMGRAFKENYLVSRINSAMGFEEVETFFADKEDGKHELVKIILSKHNFYEKGAKRYLQQQ